MEENELMYIKSLRPAIPEDQSAIWEILKQAIELRRRQGSRQWQDGYPNPQTVADDISKNQGFVFLADDDRIVGYVAIIENDEPAYENIDGRWLTEGDFIVLHRLAISQDAVGRGMAKVLFKIIEDFVRHKNFPSIRVDTNFDNIAVLKTLDRLGYQYCGEVLLRGAARKAFEKVLK